MRLTKAGKFAAREATQVGDMQPPYMQLRSCGNLKLQRPIESNIAANTIEKCIGDCFAQKRNVKFDANKQNIKQAKDHHNPSP